MKILERITDLNLISIKLSLLINLGNKPSRNLQ